MHSARLYMDMYLTHLRRIFLLFSVSRIHAFIACFDDIKVRKREEM